MKRASRWFLLSCTILATSLAAGACDTSSGSNGQSPPADALSDADGGTVNDAGDATQGDAATDAISDTHTELVVDTVPDAPMDTSPETAADSSADATEDLAQEASADAAEDIAQEASADTAADTSSPSDTMVVSGIVKRTAQLSGGIDGIGTLCLAIAESCPSMVNMDPTLLTDAVAEIKDANLVTESATVPFEIVVVKATALKGTTYAVTGFLLDDGSSCVNADGTPNEPAKNDLVTFDLTVDPCPSFVYDGNDVTGLVVDLNFNMPM